MEFNGDETEHLIIIFKPEAWLNHGAYFWDSLIEDSKEWAGLKYQWVASSVYGDQVIVTNHSPLHKGTAVYMHGPDMAGPSNDTPGWICNILYLGNSYDSWLERVRKYGDEYSIGPGCINEQLGSKAGEYRELYRGLNPGLTW